MRLSGTKTGSANQYNGLGDQLYDLGGARPTLDLNFANNGSLVDSVTGKTLVQHTRQSNATYVDGDGVIRTATTNLLLRSEEFETTWGTFGLSVTANQETAPNGALTADLISINGSGQGIWQPVTSAPGVQYTFSVYVKLGTLSAANYKIAVRDDTAGVFIASDVEPTQAPSSNGWTRISYTATAPAGCTTIRFYAFRNTANVTGTIYLWGAQLETGSTATAYIPTTTSAVTVVESPWYRQDEGTVFAEATPIGDNGSNQFVYALAQGTGIAEEIFLFKTPGTNSITNTIRSSSNFQFGNSTDSLSPFGSNFKNAIGASSTSTSSAVNGVIQGLDTSVVMPTIDNLVLGKRSNNTFSGNFLIRRLTYWPARLPDSTLQTLTQ